MAQDGNRDQRHGEKVHPLFTELYLSGDLDDDEGPGRRRRNRLNRKASQKQELRNA
jgi:hypothetical protein